MASSVSVIATTTNHASQHHHMDRLDAARALLGVSPSPQTSEPTTTSNSISKHGTSRVSASNVSFVVGSPISNGNGKSKPTSPWSQERPALAMSIATMTTAGQETCDRTVSFQQPEQQQQQQQQPRRFELAPPAIISTGLDALAALASSEQASWEFQQRLKTSHRPKPEPVASLVVSASTTASSSSDDDSEAMPPPPPRIGGGGRRRSQSNPEGMDKWAPASSRRHFVLPASILEEELAEANAAMEAHERHNQLKQKLGSIQEDDEQQQQPKVSLKKPSPISGLLSEEEQANLSPEELLKRARSRLLEDLSEGNINGEKGVLTLPHSLSKYKEVYNKNGRIGIYTPAERAAIIARFNSKRSRRVWNKKIRYNCRKNLADRRMRVKGRFVKRSTEQQARAEAATAPVPGSDQMLAESSERDADEDMPDVTDPEAGFCPTEDQPYRRTRRHTIT